jgi:flagellar assembly factor FliW
MQISTSRFGFLTVQPEEIITFPAGILGLEDCHRWVLLADGDNPALAWLQSASHGEVALAVVNPRRFVPNYVLRVSRRDLDPLHVAGVNDAEILAIVGCHNDVMTLNLKAPLVINVERRLGRQVVVEGEAAVRYALHAGPIGLRRAA